VVGKVSPEAANMKDAIWVHPTKYSAAYFHHKMLSNKCLQCSDVGSLFPETRLFLSQSGIPALLVKCKRMYCWIFLSPLQQLPKLLSVQSDCKGENSGQEGGD